MRISEVEITKLTQNEVQTLVFFLLKNKHFKRHMFLYSRWEFLFSLVLISVLLYFINKKFNFFIMIEKKDTKEKSYYCQRRL